MNKLSATILCLVASSCGSSEPKASKEEIASARAAVSKARKAYDDQIARWRQGVRKLASGTLPDGGKACTEEIPGLAQIVLRKAELGKLDNIVPNVYKDSLKWLGYGMKVTAPDHSHSKRSVQQARRYIKQAVPKQKLHATMVVLDETRPIMGKSSYSRGMIHARILLWSVPKAAFICACELTENTPDIAMQVRGGGDRQKALMHSFESHVFFRVGYPKNLLRALPPTK